MKKILLACLCAALCRSGEAQNVSVTVKVLSDRVAISPFIYGRNNSLSGDPGSPVPAASWQLYKDAGLNFFRENGGNRPDQIQLAAFTETVIICSLC